MAERIVFDNYDATITKIDAPAHDLRIIQFTLEKPVSFVAGQYVSVVYPGVKPAPFSIASSPQRHQIIELGIEIVGGPVTSRLQNAQLGDRLILRGPFGRFVLGDERKICFLAGGVGVTPFMSMLRWICDTQQKIDATLIYSCRQGRFLWFDELEHITTQCPNVQVVFTCTREAPAGWMHGVGRIDADVVRSRMPDFMERTFYTCGPREFIDAMFAMLRSLGVPESQMKKEVW